MYGDVKSREITYGELSYGDVTSLYLASDLTPSLLSTEWRYQFDNADTGQHTGQLVVVGGSHMWRTLEYLSWDTVSFIIPGFKKKVIMMEIVSSLSKLKLGKMTQFSGSSIDCGVNKERREWLAIPSH